MMMEMSLWKESRTLAPPVLRPQTPPPTASTSEAEHAMEVEVSGMPQLTSEDATTVTPEEDDMLTSDPISVTGEMAWLEVTPPKSHELEDGEAS